MLRAIARPVFILILILFLALAGCTPRGVVTLLPGAFTGAASGGVSLRPVFVASNRLPGSDRPDMIFQQAMGDVRDPTLRFAQLDISIPPTHVPGRIEWPPDTGADPQSLADLPVLVLDLSDIEGGDRTGHSTAFTAPAAIRLLRDLTAQQ